MGFQEIAERLWPCWLLGIFMLIAVLNSKHKALVRVDFKSVKKWSLFLIALTVYRFFYLHFMWHTPSVQASVSNAFMIPWTVLPMVFWEDMTHTVPLALLYKYLPNTKVAKVIKVISMLVLMVDFGAGHLYQGPIAAVALSAYIPLTYRIGLKKGFGTTMICHILYDLSTILLIQGMARFM